jgi:hypothetical protein
MDGFLTSTLLTRPGQYDFNTDGTSIILTTPTLVGEQCMLLRNTPLTPYVVFADGAMLTAEQLNRLARVNLYRDQEQADTLLTGQETATTYGQWNRMPRHLDPDVDTLDEIANTVSTTDQKKAAALAWLSSGWKVGDAHVATTGALSARFDVIVSDTTPPLPAPDYRQGGKLWINTETVKLYYWLPGGVQAWVELIDYHQPYLNLQEATTTGLGVVMRATQADINNSIVGKVVDAAQLKEVINTIGFSVGPTIYMPYDLAILGALP